MYCKLKIKRMAVIILSIAGVTMMPTSNGLAANKAVYYNSTNNFLALSINNPSPRTITLGASGNYRLVGAASAGSFVSQDPNEIVEIVNTNDNIVINGSGNYNVIMDNVDISTSNNSPVNTPFIIGDNANVNLALQGNNVLRGDLSKSDGDGINVDKTSTLTITELSKGSSLDVAGRWFGIYCEDITVKGGHIKVSARQAAISICGLLTMEGGRIEGFRDNSDLDRNSKLVPVDINIDNIKMHGGSINASIISMGNPYDGEVDLTINKGDINADKTLNISRNMTINDAEIHTGQLLGVGNPDHHHKVIINHGVLQAGEISNVSMELNDGEIFTRSIDGAIWDTNTFNSIFKNLNNVRTNDEGKVTAYTSEYFDINGGSINGIQYISK